MHVYCIRNRLNGKCYVGQTIMLPPRRRWIRHRGDARDKQAHMPIAFAISKYGKENFDFEVLCACKSQAELDWMERVYACVLNSFCPNGYNLKAGAGRGSCSVETAARIGAAHRGKTVSLQGRRNLVQSHRGYHPNAETCARLSASLKGRRGSDWCYQRSVAMNARDTR